jgi:hypothetical protein
MLLTDSERSTCARSMDSRPIRPALATSPRHQRAIQYFACPDWSSDRLQTDAIVNGSDMLKVTDPKAVPVAGAIGLFVDIGSESHFSNLTITPR